MSESNFNQEEIKEVKVNTPAEDNAPVGGKILRILGTVFVLAGGAAGIYFGFIFVSNILNWIGNNYELKTTGVGLLDLIMTGSTEMKSRGTVLGSLLCAIVLPLVIAVVGFVGGNLLKNLCKDAAYKIDGKI